METNLSCQIYGHQNRPTYTRKEDHFMGVSAYVPGYASMYGLRMCIVYKKDDQKVK